MFVTPSPYMCLTIMCALTLTACAPKSATPVTQSTTTAPPPPTAKLTGTVNVYNFLEYIPESFRPDFEKATGVQVNYDVYPDNETLNAKLIAGQTGYDVVTTSNDWSYDQINNGQYLKLDKSKIPNLKNLDPNIMRMLRSVDPTNDYLIPWSWGYAGIGINTNKVTKALGDTPLPDNPFDLVFNPTYTRKLKSCGIFMHNSPSITIPLALQYIGKSDHSDTIDDYKAAGQMLKTVRKDIRKFGDSADVNAIADGNYCVFLSINGDINAAAQRAGDGSIKPLLGKGGLLYIDSMAIPADAKNTDNAYAWINYSLEPKVAAQLTNELGFTTPNQAAIAFVTPELAKNPTIFLSEQSMASMVLSPRPKTQEGKRAVNDTFRQFKTGR
jgi:putrescine transport system substrate-binding protein